MNCNNTPKCKEPCGDCTQEWPRPDGAQSPAEGDRVRAALERFCDATACIPMPGERVTTTMVQTLGMALSEARAALAAPNVQPKHTPTPEDIDAQDWAGMDGATAYQLIERHGEDWSHIGRLMTAWLAANTTQSPAPSQPKGAEPVYRRRTDAEALDCANRLNRSFPPSSLKDEAADHIRELVAVVQAPAPAPAMHSTALAGLILTHLGYSTEPSLEPGADMRRDALARRLDEWLSPSAPCAAVKAEDSQDAARYRFLRGAKLWPVPGNEYTAGLCVDLWGEDGAGEQMGGPALDDAVDAAMAAQGVFDVPVQSKEQP